MGEDSQLSPASTPEPEAEQHSRLALQPPGAGEGDERLAVAETPQHARWRSEQSGLLLLQEAALEVARLRRVLREERMPYGLSSEYSKAERAFWALRQLASTYSSLDEQLLLECERRSGLKEGGHRGPDQLIWKPAPAGLPEPTEESSAEDLALVPVGAGTAPATLTIAQPPLSGRQGTARARPGIRASPIAANSRIVCML
jgi:hypothetical protein